MIDVIKVLLTTDNVILALLALALAANVMQFMMARSERKEAWRYVDRLTEALSEMRILLEVIRATIKIP